MKIINEHDPRMVYMPLEDATKSNGLCRVIRDNWWLVHPEHGMCLWSNERRASNRLAMAAPLCNSNEAITRSLLKMWPFAEVQQVALVLLPRK
jgi:hypothetical protein